MKYADIEEEARRLQCEIWLKREALDLGNHPQMLELLNPVIGAAVLNVDFEYRDQLGRFGSGHDRFEVAGMLDRQARKIAVSRGFPYPTMRFTGAHELGHWLLHRGEVMHRDRPINGMTDTKRSRPPKEKEADYFAACFLVPRKFAGKAFEKTFQMEAPLKLDDTSAFWLSPGDPDHLLGAETGSLDFALAVASATYYGGRHFHSSLAKQFDVSVTTMAIRLRELRLIEE